MSFWLNDLHYCLIQMWGADVLEWMDALLYCYWTDGQETLFLNTRLTQRMDTGEQRKMDFDLFAGERH